MIYGKQYIQGMSCIVFIQFSAVQGSKIKFHFFTFEREIVQTV